MTTEEIKKTLIREIRNYTKLGLGSLSFAKFCKEILNCITCLEAEADKYYNAAKIQQDVSMKRFFEIKRLTEENNRQQAKIEALQMDKSQLHSDNANANMNSEHLAAEIERLKKLLAEEEEKYELCAKKYYIVGAEDFAERLKNLTSSIVLSGGKYKYDVVTTQGIDYVLKEITGDEK